MIGLSFGGYGHKTRYEKENGSTFVNGPNRSLFDLSIDEREQADFSSKNPDIRQRLSNDFDKWNEQMLPRPSE
jgi:hypothetical protein